MAFLCSDSWPFSALRGEEFWGSGVSLAVPVGPLKDLDSLVRRQVVEDRIDQLAVGSDVALDSELSNALIESTNTKIRLLTRIAFGFENPKALIALAMLALGGQRPTLPGRS